jgi:NAD(P)-dependent dehydrogenase (short-subunit alcohol dehydrogenase family)
MKGTVIITGASRGIGAATARLAGASGWNVVVNYHTNEAGARSVCKAIQKQGGKSTAVEADVSDERAVAVLFDKADAAFGRVDALVNNGGWNGGKSTVADIDVEVLRRTLEVNVIGSYLCAREAVRRMSTERGGKGGVIVNVASVAALHGSPGERVHYAASKGAIVSFTIGLAKEVIRQGIRVNAITPGMTLTEMNAPDRLAQVVPTIPIGRAAEPEEIARAILFLISADSSYMVGANMIVGGGR